MTLFDPPDYLEPSYKPVYGAWKSNPTPQTTGELLRAVKPEINKGVLAHVGSNASPLLKSRARLLTLDAIKRYDPTKAKLGTHIVNHLQGLKRIARSETSILRVPERVGIEQNRVRLAKQELTDSLGREPSLDELSDATGLSLRRLNYIRKFKPPVAEGSLLGLQGDEGSEDFSPGVVKPGQKNPWVDLVYADVDPVNKKIMEWTLGLHGEPTLSNQEIARRLRVTPAAISQRKAKIQMLLEEGNTRSPF